MGTLPGREPLNYGLILLLLALIAYAAIGLTLRVEPTPGDGPRKLDGRAIEPDAPASVVSVRDGAPALVAVPGSP
jgi:hypothetical protein